jgi:hypothetical protein
VKVCQRVCQIGPEISPRCGSYEVVQRRPKRLWRDFPPGTPIKKETLANKKERESLSPSLLTQSQAFRSSPGSCFTSGAGGRARSLLPFYAALRGAARPRSPPAPPVPLLSLPAWNPHHLKNFNRARTRPSPLVLSLIPFAPSVSSTMPAGDVGRRCGFSSRTSFRLGLLQAFSKRFKRFDFPLISAPLASGRDDSARTSGQACRPLARRE